MTQIGVSAVSVVSHSIAAMVRAAPRIGNILYLPVLEMRMPEKMAMPMRPTIMGSISRPDSAAEVPEDICRKVGHEGDRREHAQARG